MVRTGVVGGLILRGAPRDDIAERFGIGVRAISKIVADFSECVRRFHADPETEKYIPKTDDEYEAETSDEHAYFASMARRDLVGAYRLRLEGERNGDREKIMAAALFFGYAAYDELGGLGELLAAVGVADGEAGLNLLQKYAERRSELAGGVAHLTFADLEMRPIPRSPEADTILYSDDFAKKTVRELFDETLEILKKFEK